VGENEKTLGILEENRGKEASGSGDTKGEETSSNETDDGDRKAIPAGVSRG